MSPYGVIFDMDGVLVLSEEAHWLAWRDAAARRGVQLAYETFLSCFGRVNSDCVRIMIGPEVTAEESERIAVEKEAAMRAIIRDRVPIAPQTGELLDALRSDGALLAVGSSAPPENVDLVLDGGRIRDHFAAVVDGTQVRRGKPAPDVFLLAGERLGVPASLCAVIEDAPAGIIAARAAGMTAIGLATTHTPRQLLDAGAHVVHPAMPDLSVALVRAAIAQASCANR
ncbi:MAG: HAD family phosphatase [Phycisphaerae bacterium]|jgi:beta-phosphoglucomutase|nr:HAD family phosphatase [Phycisphaerae bacterium]